MLTSSRWQRNDTIRRRMSSPNRFNIFGRLSGRPTSLQENPSPVENKRPQSVVVNFKENEDIRDAESCHSSISSEDSADLGVFACARQRPKSQQLWEKEDIILALSALPAGEAALALIPSLHGDDLTTALRESQNLNVGDTSIRGHRLSTPSFVNRYIRKASLAAENDAAAAAAPGELISKWPNTCLLVSCFFGKLELVKYLLQRGARVDACDGDGRTPLHLGACSGSVEIIEELLKHNGNPEEWDVNRKCTPLHCAAAAGDVKSVKLLLKSGANVDAGLSGNSMDHEKTPLHYAVLNDASDCVEELLRAGASPNNSVVYTETPLHVAASLGSARCVSLLLNYGADVRVQFGSARSTPLHLAAEEGSADCTKLLLEAGAPSDARNARGQSAMHLAALAQSAETVDLLIKAGSSVNMEDSDGRTPLHAAVAKAMRGGELVKALIQAGALVNKPDKYGYTPLHTAALNENSSLVTLLLTKGADVTARTKGGISALCFIVRRTPNVLPKYVGRLDQAISLHDHELGDVDCELKLDFRPLMTGGRGEAELFLCLIEAGQRHILKHPLCETFLHLKWLRIRKFFVFSLIFHSLFAIILSIYIFLTFYMEWYKWSNFLYWPVLGFTCTLACKELFQVAHGITGYAKRWENWLQWSVIIISAIVLIWQGTTWSLHAAAIGVTLVWVELMIVVGRFPMFGLYIQMFTQVAVNFFKFLGAYSCLIVGFSLGFTVIHKDYKSFANPGVGLIKTIVMMSGELEFEDMFWNATDISIARGATMHLMFLVFVILVTVILTNLLVGLAVSDIQELQRCAGLERLIRRAELVAHLESLLFSKLLDYTSIKIVRIFRKGALLLHPPHHCGVNIRPNDPRDKCLPRDLAKAVYHLVAKKKLRNRVPRYPSNQSLISTSAGDIRMSKIQRFPSTSEYSRQQVTELVADLKKCSGKLGTQLDVLTKRIELIAQEMDQNGLPVSCEMSEHQGTTFNHSCIKMPVDPFSRQPTPLYERPKVLKNKHCTSGDKSRKINFINRSNEDASYVSFPQGNFASFMDFLESIPDYGDVNHLSNEQFKQKLDYLKRKQRTLLKNLKNCLEENNGKIVGHPKNISDLECKKIRQWCTDYNNLSLQGMKCSFEESRMESPLPFPSGKFAGLAEDQDLLTYRCKDKDAKTLRNREIHSATKSWSTWSQSKSRESVESDAGDSMETKSLPPDSPKKWHPTVPKPFNFTIREEAEKYMSAVELQAEERETKNVAGKRNSLTKRHARPVPLTSKLPMYDKLLAEKEERSRMVREESAWSLMSQVRPFRLECARRALTRSSPQLCRNSSLTNGSRLAQRFRARPVPKNLFSTNVYDRMIEDDLYRSLRKKVRASELLKSSSLPPSMAARERMRSVNGEFVSLSRELGIERVCGGRESTGASVTPLPSERSRSAMTSTSLSTKGTNLAAVLRCQASREKMEREIQERMEERRREQFLKSRESVVRRRPAWRALRAAARHEHEQDLALRASLRRDEARELAERHRLHMEMMLGRVTQIPTLFERHSQMEEYFQNFQTSPLRRASVGTSNKSKKKRTKRPNSGSVESYSSSRSSSRPNSGSVASSGTSVSSSNSSKSSDSRKSVKSSGLSKKKGDRGPLKVSINETAQLIEDNDDKYERYSSDSIPSDENNASASESEENNDSVERFKTK
ncbi:uncharacterized protein pyx [Neodiprion pinetum]|uniref:uncharacterized protein pyx n=1 Tax=Neodiprion pinetum TaxID=441929 RepID=UPI00371A9377